MADNVRVQISGTRELQSAFKQLGGGLESALKEEFMGIARSVASAAASKVPRRSGRAAGSIKARASNRGASIAFGGTAAPHFPWLNFGGRVGRNRSVVRASVNPDRYIYATLADQDSAIRKAADDAVERTAKRAGFETHGEG